MLEATTYYARVTTRDNAYNESAYSVVLSTLTRGFVYVSSQSLAPANVLQGADAVMLAVDILNIMLFGLLLYHPVIIKFIWEKFINISYFKEYNIFYK